MPKRRYDVKGTNDFLVLAVVFLFLGLWAVKDGWFPSDKVLKRHPKQIEASFSVDGFIKEFHVTAGDKVVPPRDGQGPSTLLAELRSDRLERELETLQEEHGQIKTENPEQAQAIYQEILRLKDDLELRQLNCPELGKEKNGTVIEVLKERFSQVKAGEPVVIIEPAQHFYLFNKSLTYISFTLMAVFMAIHILGR